MLEDTQVSMIIIKNREFDHQSRFIRAHPVSEAVPEVMATQVLHFGELRISLHQVPRCSHRYRSDFPLTVAASLALAQGPNQDELAPPVSSSTRSANTSLAVTLSGAPSGTCPACPMPSGGRFSCPASRDEASVYATPPPGAPSAKPLLIEVRSSRDPYLSATRSGAGVRSELRRPGFTEVRNTR